MSKKPHPHEQMFLMFSLMFGPPDPRWTDKEFFYNSAGEYERKFRMFAYPHYEYFQIYKVVGISDIAADYAHWYLQQEKDGERTPI